MRFHLRVPFRDAESLEDPLTRPLDYALRWLSFTAYTIGLCRRCNILPPQWLVTVTNSGLHCEPDSADVRGLLVERNQL